MKRAVPHLTIGIGLLLCGAFSGCLAAVDFQEKCSSDYDCGTGQKCESDRCISWCDQYSACGTGRTCDLTLHRCIDNPACSSSNATAVCGAYACSLATGRCYSDCYGPNSTKADAQCGATAECAYDFTCRPTCSTVQTPACAPYICDTVMGYCDDYCSANADCAAGYQCANGTCKP